MPDIKSNAIYNILFRIILNSEKYLYICIQRINHIINSKMVKPEQIKARLKVKYPKANLSNERIDEISARLCKLPEDNADDTAIDAVLDQADAIMPFEEIAKNDDTIRTLKAKNNNPKTPEEIAKEAAEKKKAEDAAKAAEEAQKGAPDWFKTFKEDMDKKLNTLSSSYENLQKGITTQSKTQKLNELFEANEVLKGLPENIRNRALKTINLDAEDLASEVEAVSKDFEGFIQKKADDDVYAGVPGKSFSDTKPSKEEIDAVINAM